MKSKIFCFNPTIFKKNMTHFWPIWLLFQAYLICCIPIGIWTNLRTYINWDYTAREAQYLALKDALTMGISATPLFLVAIIAAMALYSYLYTAKAANMFHALPVNRCELFVTNYASGLCCLILPEVITFVIAVFVCVANQMTCIQYLLWWLLYVVVMTFFAFSMATFVAMITGQMFALPIYFVIANFLYVAIRYIFSMMVNLISYGIRIGWRPGNSGMLSPWYFMETHLSVQMKYDDSLKNFAGLRFVGEKYLVIYAVAAVVFAVAAWLLYRKRQIETAGDVISVNWVKPLFRWGFAISGGCMLSVLSVQSLLSVNNIPVFAGIVIFIIIFGFLFFFAAEMVLCKNFKVITKKRLVEWGAFTLVSIACLAVIRFDVFGVEKVVPESSEVKAAFLTLSYPVQYTEDDVDELLELHQRFIQEKGELQKLNQNDTESVTIRYILKDGSTISREYPILLNEKTVHETEGITADVVNILQRPENIVRELLGTEYESNQYMSGYVEMYDADSNIVNVAFTQEEAEQMAQAIIEDIEDGNLNSIVNVYDNENAPREFRNGISLNIYNKNSANSTSDYYYNYAYYSAYRSELASSREIYINFNEDCEHILALIKELGMEQDGRELRFYEENEDTDVYIEETTMTS